MDKKYLQIVSHYERCLDRHGDTHQGVDWPNAVDADLRYQVMLDVVRGSTSEPVELLDFGCGASHLYEYILRTQRGGIRYSGLDLSEKLITLSRAKFPGNTYYVQDVLDDGERLGSFDYIVMNGVFTEKRSLTFDEMLDYFRELIQVVFRKARIGIAFNTMSRHVDWERDDLFHLPFDLLASFLTREVSRHFVTRHDYGLYEYTTYVYRRAQP